MTVAFDKILKRENGDRVQISVSLWINNYGLMYDIEIWIAPKGKRKFQHLSFDDYTYRRLSMEDRKKHRDSEYLKHVTEAEILEAKTDLWRSIHPSNSSPNITTDQKI